MTVAEVAQDTESSASARLATQRRARAGQRAGLPRRPDPATAPLSPEQEGLWFVAQLDNGASAYNVGKTVRLTGKVDLELMRQALVDVVDRHEALRTRIVEHEGRPVQLIAGRGDPAVRPDFEVVDLRSCPPAELPARVERLTSERAATPFALDRAPLLRVTVLRLSDTETGVLVSAHHLICDGKALTVVLEELGACYDARLRGTRPALPPLTVHFPDYAAWQRERLAGELGDRQRAYWAAQLAGAPAVLELPADRPRPAEQSFAGSRCSLTSDGELAARVRRFAAAQHCTVPMVLLAALNVVLTRYSGQTDIVVGMPVARRTAELQGVVGMFANTVALRTDTSGNPTVRELLARVRAACMGAYEHADLPFDEVVATVLRERSLSHNPLFQVLFVAGDPAYDAMIEPGIDGVHGYEGRLDWTTAVVDLTWAVNIENLSSCLDYSTDLFDAATVHQFGGHLWRVLGAMVAFPDRRLWDLPMVTGPERTLLAGLTGAARFTGVGGSGGAAGSGDSGQAPAGRAATCVVESFVRQATRNPDAAAAFSLASPDGVLSYRDLELRSRSVANRLRRLGCGAEDRVALLLPGGADAVIALLGVLRAGAAYVPLDPGHPPARLGALLDDSGAGVLIAEPAGAALVPAFAGTVLTTDDEAFLGADRHGALPAITAEQLAYVIYTSGSTGEPKGVMVQHGTLRNLVTALRDAQGFGPQHRLLMTPPLSFDASVGCVFPVLTSGGTLVFHPEPAALTGPELLRLCREHDLTAADIPAPLWRRCVADLAGARQQDSPLSLLLVGGDRLPLGAVESWAEATGATTTLYHNYGPTEATVCATTLHATPDTTPDPAGYLPIGRPIPGVAVHVLDPAMRPAPPGVPGELYVGGAAPARGYLGRPGATAERFVPDPFSAVPGARLYRTGDLARFRRDGQLEYLGRADGQVKIRGHRVELAEVEAAVARHPHVREVAVVAQPDGSGPGGGAERSGAVHHLVAYVVAEPDEHRDVDGDSEGDGGGAPRQPLGARLRAFALTQLPGYMVPSAFVAIDRLPLTSHDKVDRALLVQWLAARGAEPVGERPFVPPRSGSERRLAAIWSVVLDCDRVGATDNFFELGGHSLLAARLVYLIRTEFGVRLPIRALFDTADLAELAAVLDDAVAGSGSGSSSGNGNGNGAAPGGTGQARAGLGGTGQAGAGLNGGAASDGAGRNGAVVDGGAVAGGAAGPHAPDLRAEAELPGDVCAELGTFDREAAVRPARALLTGATGFLGAYLLADVLAHTEATVHCLVNAGSAEVAAELVRANLERYGLWRPEDADRVVGLPGDLTAPRLGLTGAEFDALAGEVDVIFHSAATVSYAQPYRLLAPANVGGTIEVLRLAGHRRATPVHMVSTLGVFLGTKYAGARVTEQDQPDDPDGLGSGYRQTRWVGDALARSARARGLPVSIYRPARIGGDSRTGVSYTDDYFSVLLKTIAELGAAPAVDAVPAAERHADLAPVDHVAAGIGALSRMPHALGRDFHFYNPHTMSLELLVSTLAGYGYDLRAVPADQWHESVLRADAPLSPYVAADDPSSPPRPAQPEFDCQRTERMLAEAGLACPPADAELLRRYLDAFVNSGFLPPPRRRRRPSRFTRR